MNVVLQKKYEHTKFFFKLKERIVYFRFNLTTKIFPEIQNKGLSPLRI